jgi:hypothetical protein
VKAERQERAKAEAEFLDVEKPLLRLVGAGALHGK